VKTHFGPFVFDVSNQLLWRGSQEVPLPPRVVGVLGLLVARPGEVVSRQELIDTVWKDAFVSDTSLAEAISFLRQALGDDPQQPSYIQTVHRRGYRFLRSAGADAPGAPDAEPARSARDPWAQILPWAIAILLGAMTVSALWRLAHPDAPLVLPVARFDVALPAGTALDTSAAAIALSNRGSRLAFVACGADGCRLFTRALDEVRPKMIAGTDGAAAPFFSPDEAAIGFFADGKLKKVAVDGGAPVTLADARHPFGAAWMDDGTIVFGSALAGGLQRVAAAGGTPRAASASEARDGELRHESPEPVPGSRAVLLLTAVLAPAAPALSRIVAVSLDTGERTVVLDRASAPRFIAPDVLTFVRNGDLLAAAFDASQVKVVGQPVVVVPRVGEAPSHYAVSRVGSLAVAGSSVDPDPMLAWAGKGGALAPLGDVVQQLVATELSADGRRLVAVKTDEGRADLWWADVERGALSRLTFEGDHRSARWAPDGRAIALASRERGVFNLFARSVGENLAPRRLTSSAHHQTPGSISPDGQLVVFTDFDPSTGADIWSVPFGGGPATPVIRSPFDEAEPALSPDGRWLAYQANESNRWEVYVRPFPDPGAVVPISAGGGTSPAWSRDGRTLYYAGRPGVMSVAITPCGADLSGPRSDAIPPSSGPAPRPASANASAVRRSFSEGGSAAGGEAAGPRAGAPACDLAPSKPIAIVRGAWIPRGTAPDGRLLVERVRGQLAGVDRVSVTLQWTRELQRLVPSAVISSPK